MIRNVIILQLSCLLVLSMLRRRRLVKTCNMRGGGVGDIGVFPREYQSGTSAPRPRKCYKLQENGTFASSQQNSRKSHLLVECHRRGGVWRTDFKEWDLETRLGKYYDLPYSWKHSDLVTVSRR